MIPMNTYDGKEERIQEPQREPCLAAIINKTDGVMRETIEMGLRALTVLTGGNAEDEKLGEPKCIFDAAMILYREAERMTCIMRNLLERLG